MAFIGGDLHRNSFTVCSLGSDGTETLATHQLCRAALDRFRMGLDADDETAVEATGNSAWFRDEVISCVGRVVVVNPRQFQVIRTSVSKTDRNDARAPAFLLSKGMLPETRVESKVETELPSLTHTRALLVKQRTRAVEQDPGAAHPPRHHAEEGEPAIEAASQCPGERPVRLEDVESTSASRSGRALPTIYATQIPARRRQQGRCHRHPAPGDGNPERRAVKCGRRAWSRSG